MKIKAAAMTGFKALDAGAGTFEALVSVFGNVDLAGDRVVKGAFADSLKAWEAKGKPIPVIFSHQWDNLDAHIGQVATAEETDAGLKVKGQLDMEDPFASKVFKLMDRGTLTEFSFAYDVVEEKVQNGANELLKLDLIEVGPTLKGMNPETELLAVKALGLKAGARNSSKDAERIQTLHDLAGELGAECPETKSGGASGRKSALEGRKQAVSGSHEQRREMIQAALMERYAQTERVSAYVTATFEDRAIFALYDWSSESGNQGYREVPYTVKDDGSIELGEERDVVLEMIVSPKADEPTGKAGSRGDGDARRLQGPSASPFALRIAAELLELESA